MFHVKQLNNVSCGTFFRGDNVNRVDKILNEYREKFDSKIPLFDRTGIYGSIIQLFGAEQFTWQNLPTPMNSHWCERSVNTGLAIAYDIPNGISASCTGFAVTPAEFIGVPNQIGETNTVITRGSDYSLTFDITTDKCVLIKNNDYMYNEYYNMLWFAEMLARTDSAEKALIIWSKMHPIAKATTGIDANKLESVMRAIIDDDDFYSVINDNSKILTQTMTSKDDNVLRLTDENAVEKMHFLSEFHYELIRRYCNLYNMPFRTTAKSAQNLESELHNTDVFSKTLNENRLKCRQDSAKRISELWNVDCTVDYSKILKQENEIIETNINNEKNDNVSRETGDNNETENDDTTT